MLIGNAPCSWGVCYPTGNIYSPEQYLDQLASAGYKGTELGPLGYMPTDVDRLKNMLVPHNLTLIGATHVHTFSQAETNVQFHKDMRAQGEVLSALGARHLVVMDESNVYPADQLGVLSHDAVQQMYKDLSKAHTMLANEFGIALSFHPHIGTCIELEAQIDALLSETPLNLCLDTGHYAFWGQDPLTYMRRNWDRIDYMHLKNVDASVRTRVLRGDLSVQDALGAGVMCPLQEGVVDIAQIMEFLRANEFQGPVVVEQDIAENAIETPLELACRNFSYIAGMAEA
ncbi:sugar phosphate isomerase/epimerase [Pseudovibrio sp. Tun.PSC04-5.I4]|uniref:sugar phosphate isomerase/epimerase family protein n=1 Tax=Pseudovibrio sp. Tun.PSC04-5.I4 TaxID=1798213 RepID=UPI0008844E92|nr:sugar phosphate isomerase/epimerase [Pseudovibrio sp. Tun.PSC04-5.I4]SDQ73845.1 2-keto-myo-inositol dehydratase [Pseudovibrio sp. Tun.PSC04-5.I4]